MAFQLRPGAGADQQRVDPGGGVVDGTRADRLEHPAQFRRNEAELGCLLPGGFPSAACVQHGPHGRRPLVALGRLVAAAAVLAGREQVHQGHRHPDHDVCVTVKIHLTSYISASRLLLSKEV